MSDQYTVGEMKTIIIPNPGAGNNFTYTVPAGVRLKVRGIAFHLVTDANVVNRRAIIRIVDPDGGISGAEWANAAITANLNVNITFAPNSRAATGILGAGLSSTLSSKLMLIPGDELQSIIQNIQAGDTLTKIYLLVEAFILP